MVVAGISIRTLMVDSFTLTLNKENYSSGDELLLTIKNNEPLLVGRTIQFGQYYTIEYSLNDTWRECSWLYPPVWEDIGYELPPWGPFIDFKQSIELFPVKEGKYRVSKEIRVKGSETSITLSETFEVVNGTPEHEIPEEILPDYSWEPENKTNIINLNLNLTNLTDEKIIETAMMDNEFKTKFEGSKLQVEEKMIAFNDNRRVLYVHGKSVKEDSVAYMWFYLNKKGEVEDLRIIYT
ncbi:MAG: immunoglobulin-like domain-containing protein [Archaeoglobaceae archaeon]